MPKKSKKESSRIKIVVITGIFTVLAAITAGLFSLANNTAKPTNIVNDHSITAGDGNTINDNRGTKDSISKKDTGKNNEKQNKP
jgi:hypothetical protein